MNKAKASLVSEHTLWNLYRRTLLADLLLTQQHGRTVMKENAGPAVAAAIAETLGEHDLLGLRPRDLTTRVAGGAPPAEALLKPARTRGQLAPAYSAVWEQRVLPGEGLLQAAVAVGAALAFKAAETGGCVVLLERKADPNENGSGASAWASAAEAAVAQRLPLVFVADRAGQAPPAAHAGPRRPPAALPSIPVDREDPLALFRVLSQATAHAREGSGPTWVDACEARLPDGSRLGGGAPPIERLRATLESRGLFSREQARTIRRGAERAIKQG